MQFLGAVPDVAPVAEFVADAARRRKPFTLSLGGGGAFPNARRMINLQEQLVAMGPPPAGAGASGGPPPQVIELEERARRAGIVGAGLSLDLVLILMLMVWGPRF